MTEASMTFGHGHGLAVPRGSMWLGSLATFLINNLRKLDNWLVSLGREQPQTAQDVLEWAARIERTEPGFAADLRAAALRSMEGDKA